MRRLLVTFAAVILTVASAAHAQPRQGGNRRPPPPPTTTPAQPTVPPPPIVYPFPPLMPPPAGGLTPRFGENPPFRTSPPLYFPFGSTAYAPFVFGYPESAEPVSVRRSQSTAPATGLLRLAVTPTGAQVFVDSFFVGTVEDLNAQRVLELEAGPHRIEMRAPQYQPITVDIRILPYETVTYRGALELTRLPVQTAPPTGGPAAVMYVIPNCYLGNLPPRQSRLPSGCDVKQVQELKTRAVIARP